MVMLKQLLSALAVYGLGFLIQKKKMENYCQRKNQIKKTSNTGENSTYHSYGNLVSSKENIFKEDFQNKRDLPIPAWAKTLIDLYRSPLKYKIRYELKNAEV